jgi:hypothetical protein
VKAVPEVKAAAREVKAAAPEVKAEDALKIRDLQYEQAKRAMEMRDLEERYQQLKTESDNWRTQMQAAIAAAAKSAGVDLAKWDFNIDTLKFTIKPPPPSQTNAKANQE